MCAGIGVKTYPPEVTVVVPAALASTTGGRMQLRVPAAEAATVGDVLTGLRSSYPVLVRRVLDETGTVRRHVNLFVDGEDIRGLERLDSPVAAGSEVIILQSIAGG